MSPPLRPRAFSLARRRSHFLKPSIFEIGTSGTINFSKGLFSYNFDQQTTRRISPDPAGFEDTDSFMNENKMSTDLET